MPKSTSFDLNSTELQIDEIDGEHREIMSTTCLERNQQVAMAWHPPPPPPPFLKRIIVLFMFMPSML